MLPYLSLVVLALVTPLCHGIRVHWNTNEGPIIPPTTTVPPVPKPPFREPAPVWEIQSNDIENPNPFVYVLPPPSRPRYNPDGVHDIYPTQNASPTNFGHYVLHPTNSNPSVVTYNDINVPAPPHTSVVPQLSVQYVANIGNRYYAIVPSTQRQQYQFHNNLKPIFWKGGQLQEKPLGKYNAKLKKYKASETKQKFVPYYTVESSQPQRSTHFIPHDDHHHLQQQQQQQQLNTT